MRRDDYVVIELGYNNISSKQHIYVAIVYSKELV